MADDAPISHFSLLRLATYILAAAYIWMRLGTGRMLNLLDLNELRNPDAGNMLLLHAKMSLYGFVIVRGYFALEIFLKYYL